MMNPTISYKQFVELRSRTAAVLEALAGAFARLDAEERASQLTKLKDGLLQDTFKVLIVGEFKRGKSTLINALLGERVLPEMVRACTATITRVRFGEHRRAILHRTDGHAPLELDLEADPEALKTHITINGVGGSDEQPWTCPYAHAEVFFPTELCRDGVELVDSPGLNEDHVRTEVTRSFLDEADAMVVVLVCDQQLTATEARFIDEDLKEMNLQDTFFVWNKYDRVWDSPAEQAHLEELSRRRLDPRAGGSARVYFVDSLSGLNAKLQGDDRLLLKSRLLEFERALESYLATERGRVKLGRPLQAAESAIREGLNEFLPQREKLEQQPLNELRSRLETCRPLLADAERSRDRILLMVERRGHAMTREVASALNLLVAALENGLPKQTQLFEVSRWQAITNRSEVKQRLARELEKWIKDETSRWQQRTLLPIVESHFMELEGDLDEEANSLCASLDAIRAAFEHGVDSPMISRPDEISGLERLLGVGVGLIGGIGSMVEGASMGVGAAAKGLAVNVATGIGLGAMGFGVRVFLPVLAAVGVWRTMTGAGRAADDLRAAVAKEFAAALRAKLPEVEREVVGRVVREIARVRTGLHERMQIRVDEVKGQVEAVLREREQRDHDTQRVLNELQAVREQLQAQSAVLEELKLFNAEQASPVPRSGGVASEPPRAGTASRPASEVEARGTPETPREGKLNPNVLRAADAYDAAYRWYVAQGARPTGWSDLHDRLGLGKIPGIDTTQFNELFPTASKFERYCTEANRRAWWTEKGKRKEGRSFGELDEHDK